MIGIILCSHSSFSTGLKNSVNFIMGDQENFEALEFNGDISLEQFSREIKITMERYGNNCIIFCDIKHGTPFNSSALAISKTESAIITGMNLPIVIEAVSNREFYDKANELLEYLEKSVINSMELFNSERLFKGEKK